MQDSQSILLLLNLRKFCASLFAASQQEAPERFLTARRQSAGTLCTCDETIRMFAGAFIMTLVHRTFGFAAALGTSALAFALTLA